MAWASGMEEKRGRSKPAQRCGAPDTHRGANAQRQEVRGAKARTEVQGRKGAEHKGAGHGLRDVHAQSPTQPARKRRGAETRTRKGAEARTCRGRGAKPPGGLIAQGQRSTTA